MAKEVKPHPKLQDLGKRIKLLRKVQRKTQAQVGERAGVSQAAIAEYEKHGVPSGVPLAIVMHIAEALDSPLSVLVYGPDEEDEINGLSSAQSVKKTRHAKSRLQKPSPESGR